MSVRPSECAAGAPLSGERLERPDDRWWAALADEVRALLDSGRFPRLSAVQGETVQDLDGLLPHARTHAPTRHLDGVAARLEWGTADP
jgi:hypothetical protein